MSTTVNSIVVRAGPEAVFDVLDDAHAYPCWVVGTRRIRHVDSTWPAVGSRFHHAIGTFVAELHDSTVVVARDRPRRLELEVRFRPTGVARVRIEVAPVIGGTRIVFEETPVAGPAEWLPGAVTRPLFSIRNAFSLKRLRRIVDRAAQPDPVGRDDASSKDPC